MEAHGEGNDEEGEDHGELEEGLHDVGEHDHVDAQVREFTDIGQQVQPGHGHRYRTWNMGNLNFLTRPRMLLDAVLTSVGQ